MRTQFLFIAMLATLLTTSCQMTSGVQSNNSVGATKNENASKDSKANTKPAEKTDGAVVTVYDGRKETGPTDEAKVSPAELTMVKAEVKKRDAEIKKQVKLNCDDGEELTVVSSAVGSFTRAGAQQKLYLYELCRAGRAFGIGGIIITEGDSVVAHQAYGENGLDAGAEVLGDINKNGLSEVLLIGLGTGQGYTEGSVSIFEFKNGNFDYWGEAGVYSDNSGASEDDSKIKTTASNITVETGAEPVFYTETYEQKGGKGSWNVVKKREILTLDKKEPAKWIKIM